MDSAKATDGDIRARLLLSLNSKDACGLCIIRPQEVQEAADEIESLREIESALRLIRNGADGALQGTAEWNMSNVYRVADAALKGE